MSRPYLTTRLLASYGHRQFLLLPTKPTACIAARAGATQQSSAASSGGNAQASRLSDAQLAWLNFDSSYHTMLCA